jgi:hypothetical protein
MHVEDTVVVFTARSPNRVVREGGSQAWVLNPVRARQCTWLVCTQNRHNADHDFEDATEAHGSAFLVGRISGLRHSEENPAEERWLVTMSEYARVDMPDVWKGWRNPVRYTALADIGIDPEALSFQPLAAPTDSPSRHASAVSQAVRGLTIAEAKRGLALTFGVGEDAIEITIRG